MTCEELLTLSLPARVRKLREEYGSHDKLATALGTKRQTVINWEHGVEPKRYADKLAALTGCSREVWLRGHDDVVLEDRTFVLLRELRDVVDHQGRDMTRALRALAKEVRALRHPRGDEAPPATRRA